MQDRAMTVLRDEKYLQTLIAGAARILFRFIL